MFCLTCSVCITCSGYDDPCSSIAADGNSSVTLQPLNNGITVSAFGVQRLHVVWQGCVHVARMKVCLFAAVMSSKHTA